MLEISYLASGPRSRPTRRRPTDRGHRARRRNPLPATREGHRQQSCAVGSRRAKSSKRSLVAMTHGHERAVEVLEQRHDDPPAAAEHLPDLAHRRRTMLGDEGLDLRRRLSGCHRAEDELRADLYDLTAVDQELERPLRSGIGREFLARRRLEWLYGQLSP